MYRTSPKIGCSTNLENLRRRAYRPRWLHFQCGWWFSLTMGSYGMVFVFISNIHPDEKLRWRGEKRILCCGPQIFTCLPLARRTVWAMGNPSFDRKTFLVVPKSSQVREVSPFTSHLWLLISEIIRTQFGVFKNRFSVDCQSTETAICGKLWLCLCQAHGVQHEEEALFGCLFLAFPGQHL